MGKIEQEPKREQLLECWFTKFVKNPTPCIGDWIVFALDETPTKKAGEACMGHLKPFLGDGLVPLKHE